MGRDRTLNRRRRRRTIGVVTSGRSDYGLLRPVILALLDQADVRVRLFVTGMHLIQGFGRTVREIEDDGLGKWIIRVPALLADDSPASVATSIARTTARFAAEFAREQPDIVVLLGDRFETLGVAAATLPFNIPLAHIHGGETTEGAIDEVIRHAVSKMSHLHFVATAEYGKRLRQMGEESWRVTVSGAPGLDGLRTFVPTPAADLERRLGVPIDRGTLLATYHPETRRGAAAMTDIDALLAALDEVGSPVLFTAPNADTGRHRVAKRLARFVAGRADRALVTSLGRQDYLSAMHHVGAMVGNSSSGIIEAPSLRLPVVNIGARQRGRIRARNVIDVRPSRAAIASAVRRALMPAFRASLRSLKNPYWSGHAARQIAARLATVALDERLLIKPFITRC